MRRTLMWTPVSWPGAEHAEVRADDTGFVVDGVVVAHADGAPVRLHYRIDGDGGWRTRRVQIDLHDHPPLVLESDGAGSWRDRSGNPRPELAGSIDVDIALTPFTNTLPIRRLGMAPGESADIRVVYVQVGAHPDVSLDVSLDVSKDQQRYTRDSATDGVYLFESGGFSARLPVDPDGIVTDYPDLWRRVA